MRPRHHRGGFVLHDLALLDIAPDSEGLQAVGMPEVVFEVELVKVEGGDEGREVRRRMRGTQEGEGEGRAFQGNWLFSC